MIFQSHRPRLAAVLVAGALILAAAGAGAGSLSQLQAQASNIQSVKADFIQQKHLNILDKPLISQGRVYFRQPGDLRWEYTAPVKTVMLMKGGQVRMFVWDEGRWVEDASAAVQARRSVLSEITAWFNGNFAQSSTFTPQYRPGPPPKVILTPSSAARDFVERIELTLSNRPGVIDTVTIEEGNGNRTVMNFRNVMLNARLDDALFSQP